MTWFCFPGDFLSLWPYCLVPLGDYFLQFFLRVQVPPEKGFNP